MSKLMKNQFPGDLSFFFDYEYLREFKAKSGTARKVV